MKKPTEIGFDRNHMGNQMMQQRLDQALAAQGFEVLYEGAYMLGEEFRVASWWLQASDITEELFTRIVVNLVTLPVPLISLKVARLPIFWGVKTTNYANEPPTPPAPPVQRHLHRVK